MKMLAAAPFVQDILNLAAMVNISTIDWSCTYDCSNKCDRDIIDGVEINVVNNAFIVTVGEPDLVDDLANDGYEIIALTVPEILSMPGSSQ